MSSANKNGLGLFIKRASAAGNTSSGLITKPKNVKKRWMLVGGALVALIVTASTILGDKQPVVVSAKKPSAGPMVNVTPPNVNKDEFMLQFSADVARLNKEMQGLRAEKEAQDKRIQQLLAEGKDGRRSPLPDGVVPPPTKPGSNDGGIGLIGAAPMPPVPPVPPVRVPSAGKPAGMAATIPEIPALSVPASDPMVFDAPAKPVSAKPAPEARANVQFKKNPNVGMLPAGAFVSVSLLNGLDAGTSASTQSNPMPILVNVLEHANLPGAAKYKLKNCFALGTAYGDLSAERVYARIARLSCVDKAGRMVLSQEAPGYLVDSDGKLGMRGLVTNRQGARLHTALLAGFAQGLSSALGQAQGSVVSNLSTGTASTALGGAAALRSSGLSGAQSAAAQLAEFYLKEAQSIFPVISIDTGRTGTVVFSSSVSLNWQSSDNQFVQEIKPTN